MTLAPRPVRATGFTLLPVILAMSLIAAIAFLLNRDNGVNARMIANRSDLDRARYAAEAGLQAVNFVIQGMGCTGTNYPTSSPVTNFFGATYSAYASRASLTSNAPITLYSTGSYNGASVTLTRNTVYVYQSSRTTTVVRPGQSGQPAGYDTYLDSGSPDRNFGGDSILKLSSTTYQSLLKFDLSAFPIGSRAIPWYDGTTLQPGAKLSLYQTNNGPITSAYVNAQLITTSNWVAGTKLGGTGPDGATWLTYDANATLVWPSPPYAPAPVASTPYINALKVWVEWDLTNAAAAWMSGVYPPNGIWLVASDATVGNTAWVSSNATTLDTNGKSARPKLTLTTLLPCGATAPPSASDASATTTTVTLGAYDDTYLDASNPYTRYGSASTMWVGGSGTGPDASKHMVLRFDVSGIPTGKVITSATLRLNAKGMSSTYFTNFQKNLDAYALTEFFYGSDASWVARTDLLNWTTLGGTYGSSKIATGCEESSGLCPLPILFTKGWVTWDLTALVQGWVDGVTPNNGFLVRSNANDSTYLIQFITKENNSSGGTLVPQLVVVYQ